MNTFLKVLQWFIFILCFMTPIVILVGKCYEMPYSAILCGMFGYPIGVLASKLFL